MINRRGTILWLLYYPMILTYLLTYPMEQGPS